MRQFSGNSKTTLIIIILVAIAGIVIFWFVNHQQTDKHIQAQKDQLGAQVYEHASQSDQLDVQAARIEIQASQQIEHTWQQVATQQTTAQGALEFQGLAEATQLQIQATQIQIQAYQQESQADQLRKQAYLQASLQEH